MTTEKALDLALEVLQINLTLLEKINPYKGQEDLLSDSLDLTHKAITAIKQARSAPVQELPVFGPPIGILMKMEGDETRKLYPLKQKPAPVQEPVAWVDLLKQAEEIVRSKSLWKKYINGTPLANDIAVWMVSFAQEHTSPPGQPAPVQEPVDTLISAWQALEETSGHVLDVGDVEGRMHMSVIRSAWEQMDSLVREMWDERGRP
jgi:hypothetical protein